MNRDTWIMDVLLYYRISFLKEFLSYLERCIVTDPDHGSLYQPVYNGAYLMILAPRGA